MSPSIGSPLLGFKLPSVIVVDPVEDPDVKLPSFVSLHHTDDMLVVGLETTSPLTRAFFNKFLLREGGANDENGSNIR